ncbi:MAG: EAL domain-containing protein [Candidatus Paracaedibacteraceae bacterium]|nr:EAL domain-containing protein [Candidatus Paracaedibacteraceae bacterium]
MQADQQYRILVIDDNPAIHDDVRRVLMDSEIQVSDTEAELFGEIQRPHIAGPQLEIDSAYNGIDGYKMVIDAYEQGNPYAVAFVDVRMPPGWDGIKTIKEFWDKDPDIQVVICSAYSDYSWTDIMRVLGLSDRLLILKKPFEFSEVKQLVSTLTRKWSISRELTSNLNTLESQIAIRTQELQKTLAIATATLESSQEGLLVLDNQGNILNYNQRFIRMWRIPGKIIKRMSQNSLNEYLTETAKVYFLEKNFPASKVGQSIEISWDDGRTFVVSFFSYLIDDIPQGILVSTKDETQRKLFEKELTYEATHDYLTGLPNRFLLVDRLKQALTIAQRNSRGVGVIYFDLDRFKYINDTLGHAVGDGLLQGVAAHVRSIIRESDTLCRLGGDEFVAVINDVDDEADLTNFVQRLQQSLEDVFIVDNYDIRVGCSIGVSCYPQHGTNPDILLSNADSALYHAKENGRGSFFIYSEGMSDKNTTHVEIERQLKFALEKEELRLLYQPIIDAETEAIVGVETLIRWDNSVLGSVAPADFIPIAEKSGTIVAIGKWIITSVQKELLRWKAHNLDLYAAINISGIQLKSPDFLKLFCEFAENKLFDLSSIEVELTESILLEQSQSILDTLNALRTMGIRISLDDFGTGYSSLTYLRRFPVDKIKIERAFITNIHNERDSEAIVSAIIAMAHKLGLETVAEGVEYRETVSILKEMSCNYLQGYLFSKPVTSDEIIERYAPTALLTPLAQKELGNSGRASLTL